MYDVALWKYYLVTAFCKFRAAYHHHQFNTHKCSMNNKIHTITSALKSCLVMQDVIVCPAY